VTGRGPVRVVLKVLPGVALRDPAVAREIEAAFHDGAERGKFTLPSWSIQPDHLHLELKAKNADELSRAMKSICSLFALAVNRALDRSGRVLADRYRILGSDKPGETKLPCGCPARKAAPRPAR
jgi:hypothetical protein